MENTETHENLKKKSSIALIVLVLILLVTFLAIAGYAYAKYKTYRNGTAQAQVAEFNFDLKNLSGQSSASSGTISFPITRTDGNPNVQTDLLAPDTYGRFDMLIDTTGTQVAYRYDIDITVTNCPTNILFYSDSAHTQAISVIRTGTGTEQDPKIATFTISKYVPLNRANEVHKEIVYWDWPFETGTGNEIHANDLIDSADMAKTVTMSIVASASQVNEQPQGIAVVGEQTISVKDIVEIDLPAPGGERAVTINRGSQLNVTLLYDNPPANIETVSVVSSDSSVATGTFNTSTNKVLINALKPGTATITLRGEKSWDLIGTINVTVQGIVEELSLSSDNSTVSVERSTTQNVTITNFASMSPIEIFTISSSDSNLATATYDNNGTITITAGANPGTATITLTGSSSNSTKTITVKVPYQIGDDVDYSTTLNSVTLDDWRVFYKEGDYTYIILGDYLPKEAIDITSMSGLQIANTYGISSNVNRATLVNAMITKSNWDDLLNGSLNGKSINLSRNENIWAMGGATIELYINSWNACYPNQRLYKTLRTNMDDGLDGYYIGNTENPTSTNVNVSDKEGYNNSLYYPYHAYESDCFGYWLASLSACSDWGTNRLLMITCSGYVSNDVFNNNAYGFRPVIRLPSSVLE